MTFYINMPKKNDEKQSLAGFYAGIVMKKTNGTFKDKYIAAMVALMGSNIEGYDKEAIAAKVYETIVDNLGEMPENANPTDKISELFKSYGHNKVDKVDITELIMEIEVPFDVFIPEDDYSIAGLANAVLGGGKPN